MAIIIIINIRITREMLEKLKGGAMVIMSAIKIFI